MCLSHRDNITLFSNEYYSDRAFLEYIVEECDNETSKVTCKPRDQIIDYVRKTTIHFLS